MQEIPNDIVFLTVIAGRKLKDDLLDEMIEHGCKLLNVTYGRGSVKDGFFQTMLGLVPEVQKVIITCLTRRSKADDVIKALCAEFGFEKANTGIAFTIPVQKLSF